METIICQECGNEVKEGEALNGYCPECVDKYERREKANQSPVVNVWETTVDDIADVLGKMGEDIALAPEIFNEIDRGEVSKAALQFTDLDEQIEGAYNEIKRQIPAICEKLY